MKCPACAANLGRLNAAGEKLIRNRGLVLKAEGGVALCPRCGGDVPFSAEIASALRQRMELLPKATHG